MATKKLTPKSSKPSKSTPINALVPVEATETQALVPEVANETNTALVLSSEASEKELPVKAVPKGYTNYTAVDVDGTVFVTCQAKSREYVSAVIVDSPLGRIVARWSRDHKACVRYARAIDLQLKGGTPGMSNAVVVDVKASETVPEGASMYTRTRESVYYKAVAFAAAQADSPALQGPIQQA